MKAFSLAQRRLVRRRLSELHGRLFRTAFAWTHDRALADDLVQETMVRALERAQQLREQNALDAWVFAILSNCHRDALRRRGRDVALDDDETSMLDAGWEPDQRADQQALIERIHTAMARLSDDQRKVLTLVDLEGFSYVEVAEILAVPVGTVMSRLSRARQRMKSMLTVAGTCDSRIAYLEPRR